VCRADQCIGPGPEFRDSPIPAGNCGPVSSDVHVLDRHVCILYKIYVYIYISNTIPGKSIMLAVFAAAAVAAAATRYATATVCFFPVVK
jgi:hypothetical protein